MGKKANTHPDSQINEIKFKKKNCQRSLGIPAEKPPRMTIKWDEHLKQQNCTTDKRCKWLMGKRMKMGVVVIQLLSPAIEEQVSVLVYEQIPVGRGGLGCRYRHVGTLHTWIVFYLLFEFFSKI